VENLVYTKKGRRTEVPSKMEAKTVHWDWQAPPKAEGDRSRRRMSGWTGEARAETEAENWTLEGEDSEGGNYSPRAARQRATIRVMECIASSLGR
jgi:hypothetical protein